MRQSTTRVDGTGTPPHTHNLTVPGFGQAIVGYVTCVHNRRAYHTRKDAKKVIKILRRNDPGMPALGLEACDAMEGKYHVIRAPGEAA